MSDTNDDAKASRTRQANAPDADVGGIAADRLRSIVDRIERLEQERKALGDDIKDIYSEAKSAGFETPPHTVPTVMLPRFDASMTYCPAS